MPKRKKRVTGLPRCQKRRMVNGTWMCYAIGCCEVGDMPCECETCDRINCTRSEGAGNPLPFVALESH